MYGKPQFPMQEDSDPKPPLTIILRVQQVLGSSLYYTLAVDCNFLVAISDLASEQLNASTKTCNNLMWLLNYSSTNPDASIPYILTIICLHAHSGASYLSAPKACSRAAGHFFFGDKPTQRTPPVDKLLNGPIHMVYKIIKNVMGSAVEADIGKCYINALSLLPILVCAQEMGHPQVPTSVKVDNTMAVSFAKKTIKQKMTEAIDMIFHWLQDRKDQTPFTIYWSPIKKAC